MQARAPLMIEHRLIERMIRVVARGLEVIERNRAIDPAFVDLAVDFVRTYADRTHHGKEEDILFRLLEPRDLAETDRRVMNELIAEHAVGRRTTKALVEANARYRGGDDAALAEVAERLRTLVAFYPAHIDKEDKVFFPASRAYLTEAEERAMLAAFREFDRGMIHERYRAVVAGLESG